MRSRRALLLLLLPLAACRGIAAGTDAPPPRTALQEEAVKDAIRKRRIVMGMTRGEVRASWGEPVSKKWETRTGGRVETWFYGFNVVYFHPNGHVVGWGGDGVP